MLAAFGWGAVLFKEQAVVLLGGKKSGVMELTRTPLSAHSRALALGLDGLVHSYLAARYDCDYAPKDVPSAEPIIQVQAVIAVI